MLQTREHTYQRLLTVTIWKGSDEISGKPTARLRHAGIQPAYGTTVYHSQSWMGLRSGATEASNQNV